MNVIREHKLEIWEQNYKLSKKILVIGLKTLTRNC